MFKFKILYLITVVRCDGVELNVCCNNTKFLLLIVKLINFLLTFKVTNPIQGCYSSLYFCTQHNFVQCLVFRVQRVHTDCSLFVCNHTWWYEILLSINCKYHHRATDCLLQCIYFQIFGGKCWELKLLQFILELQQQPAIRLKVWLCQTKWYFLSWGQLIESSTFNLFAKI